MATGMVEVMVDDLEVLNQSLTPPFYIADDSETDEALRLRYRYLDLRRPEMQRNLRLRHQVVKYIRDFLDARDFLGDRNPDSNQEHSRGRSRLPGDGAAGGVQSGGLPPSLPTGRPASVGVGNPDNRQRVTSPPRLGKPGDAYGNGGGNGR